MSRAERGGRLCRISCGKKTRTGEGDARKKQPTTAIARGAGQTKAKQVVQAPALLAKNKSGDKKHGDSPGEKGGFSEERAESA